MASEMGDGATPMGDAEGERDEDGDGEDDGDIDEELAAELDLALVDDEGDDEDDDESEEEEDDDEDEEDEDVQARKLLNEEIRDLEAAVAKKGNEIASSSNPLIKVNKACAGIPHITNLVSSETFRRHAEKDDCGLGDEACSKRGDAAKATNEEGRHGWRQRCRSRWWCRKCGRRLVRGF
jgi:TATA-binding protein-associated factor Taf7